MDKPSLLRAALKYARAFGWSVFPIDGKVPITAHGYQDASRDPEVIRAWWEAYPDAWIGVACRASGFIAIDEDPRNGGTETLAALEAQLGALPRSTYQRSGAGGHHILMADPSPGPEGWTRTQDTGGSIRGKLGAGVDVKCNGYIVVEPSGAYQWLALGALEAVPDAWVEALRKPVTEFDAEGIEAWQEHVGGALTEADVVALRAELAALGPRGAGGDSTFRAVALVFHAYGCSVETGAEHLEWWNEQNGKPHGGAELARQVERIAQREFETNRGHRRPSIHGALVSLLTGGAPTAKAQPEAREIDAYLRAAADKYGRSTDPDRKLVAKTLRAVLNGRALCEPGEDAEAALADAALYVCATAPTGITDAQVASLLARSAKSTSADQLLAVAAAAREIVSAPQPKAPSALADEPPEDDEALRARLMVDKEGGAPRVCGTNIELILRWSSETRERIHFNVLTKQLNVSGGIFVDEKPNGLDVAVKVWLESAWNLHASSAAVGEHLLHVARRWGELDPLAEYLDGLAWDGVPRIDAWLPTYAGAEATPYAARVGAMWLISAVARGLAPGSKVDTMLVLEGDQGAKKSTALSVLGGEWFCDTPLRLDDKDSRMLAAQKWILEMAELDSLRGRQVETIKAFLSASRDSCRPPYGRVNEDFERRCVFAGTTNASEYLRDQTGNRRFWCVRVGAIDVEALRRDRDQIWAEAVARYRAGERWWFDAEEQVDADKVTAERQEDDPYVEHILRWWGSSMGGIKTTRTRCTLNEVAEQALKIDVKDVDRYKAQVAASLRAAGFERIREQHEGQRRWWVKVK